MKFKKTLSFVLPLAVLVVLSLGFYYANGGNTAGSIAEELNTNGPIPVVNQQFDLVGAWTTGATLPSPRYYGMSVSYTKNDSGYVYVMGGDSTGSSAVGRNVYRYSVNGNSWTTVTQIPAPRRIGGAALLGDSIYVVGGIPSTNPPVYSVYRYSITQNSWATVGSLPDSLFYNRAQGYQDSLIYNVGGYNSVGAKASVYLFNAKTNTWRSATSLPAARADGALSICGDTLVYVCGFDAGGFATNVVYRGVISQSDRSQITWTTGANYPPGSRSRIYSAPWGSKGIIIAGGASSGFTGAQQTYTYSPGADTWTAQTNLPAVMLAYHSGSIKYNSGIWKFVVAGGVTSGPALTGNTYIFTDTLAAPPPPSAGDSTLILLQDTLIGSATQITLKKADNDSIKAALQGYVGKYRIMYRDSSQASIPDFTNYSSVIFVETSYISPNRLKAPWRDAIRNFLNSGTSGNKKSFIAFGGDFAYNYGIGGAGGSSTDTVFTNMFKFRYLADNGSLTEFRKITGVSINTGLSDSLNSTFTNFYPDAVAPLAGSQVLEQWTGRGDADSVAGVGYIGSTYNTACVFVDPRYVLPPAGSPNRGWRALFKSVVTYIKTNGGTITTAAPIVSSIAKEYNLSQNYPNPFNPTTKITFAIPQNGFVSLKVYDVSGKEVMTLVNKSMTVGTYAVDFNGSFLSSGVYFYRLESENFVETKKMMLVK